MPGRSAARLYPGDHRLAGAEIELVTMTSRETRLRTALKNIGGEYDYVLIDCPPSLGLLTVNAMVATDEVLIPIQCEYYALEGLGQLINNIEDGQGAPSTPTLNGSARSLLTMYDGRTEQPRRPRWRPEVRPAFRPQRC